MVTKKFATGAAAVAVTAVASLTFALHELDDGNEARAADKVLLASPRGPGGWDRIQPHTERPDGTVPTVSRTWARDRDDFTEVVYAFASTSAAQDDFSSSPPEKVTPDIYPETQPDDIGVKGKGADQAEYSCGRWEKGQCITWWAWLRFGSVNVELRYRRPSGDPASLTDDQLAELVTNAIEDLAAKAH